MRLHLTKTKGFTLLETAMVISIIGIIATISLPGIMGNISKYRLDTASRCLIADLRLSRHLALKENRSIRVNFLNQRSYRIERLVGSTWTPARDAIVFSEDPGRRGILFSETPEPVEFDYIGKVDNPSSILMMNEAGSTRTVEVFSTGRIIEY